MAPLDPDDEAELDTFVMLRRLLLVAWIGSHHQFATEAAELGAGFTDGHVHACRAVPVDTRLRAGIARLNPRQMPIGVLDRRMGRPKAAHQEVPCSPH